MFYKNYNLNDLRELNIKYNSAEPFPNIVLDNFLNPVFLNSAVDSVYKNIDNENWLTDKYGESQGFQVRKRWIDNATVMPEEVSQIIWWLNSSSFLHFLEKVTGLESLIADPHNEGGGIHCSSRGGRLGIHHDFNYLKKFKLFRKLNILLFANKNWQDEWNGHLELWKRDKSEMIHKISPIFNRLVIFTTDTTSWHGFPHKLKCPQDVYRISFATYYYIFKKDIKKLKNLEERSNFVPMEV